jgi:primosomal protein N' (replication factor Y)
MIGGTPICQVCIANTMRDYYDYAYGDNKPEVGARVLVSFRGKTKIGIVLGFSLSELEPDKILTIDEILDKKPLLDHAFFDLLTWVAHYYQSPLSEVMATVLPKQFRLGKSIETCWENDYQLDPSASPESNPLDNRKKKLRQLVDWLAQVDHPVNEAMMRQAGFSKVHWETLQENGLIRATKSLVPPLHAWQEKPYPKLNNEQQQAVDSIVSHLNRYQCFLLQGVTGSGKTEVYQQVIEHVIAAGKQVLLLVPEIGLTPQLLARFQRRFKHPMMMIHSQLNDNERFRAWVLAREGKVSLVIGTRTALFTPLPNLGLIVLDEEHDASFKQLEGVRYSARDSAIYRASLANVPVILGSATPSLESLQNVALGKYQRLVLKQRAISTHPVHYQIVDLRRHQPDHGLAKPTLEVMKKHLDAGNQVLVFLNRRGFAPVILCHVCGWIADCPHCDSHLNFHRQDERYHCHLCGYHRRPMVNCQACQSTELISVGAGTQRLEPFLTQTFPDYPVLRVDRDQVKHKGDWAEKLSQIADQSVKIIVGTQMLAKGHDFHHITCVVIVDADTGLLQSDFRAVERMGQLLIQVSGRAGRGHKAGEVMLQTHQPQHPMLNLLIQYGYERFAEGLLANRQLAKLPPFSHLALFQAKARKAGTVLTFLHKVKQWLSNSPVQCLGPAPAQVARQADEYRYQLLFKSDNRAHLQQTLSLLRDWLTINKYGSNVRWIIDRDPQDML